MSNVYHGKKHDINDSRDHTKNELELNDYFMLQNNKYLWLGGSNFLMPQNMDDWSDSLTNWSGVGLTLDSTDKIQGTNSIKVNATGTQTHTYTYPSSIDLTNAKVLHWWAKRISKNATINWIRFYTDSSNYYEYVTSSDYKDYWNEMLVHKTSFSAVGTPNWNNITYFEINQTNTTPTTIVLWDKIYWSAEKGLIGNENIGTATWSGDLNVAGYMQGTFIGDGSNLTNVTPDMQDGQVFYMDTADTKGISWNAGNSAVTTEYLTDWYFENSIPYLSTDYGTVFDGIGAGNNYIYYDSTGYLVISSEGTNDQLYLYGKGSSSIPGLYLETGANSGMEFVSNYLYLNSMPLRMDSDNGIFLDDAHTKRLLWSSANSRFEFNGDIYTSGSYIGDGSQLTGIGGVTERKYTWGAAEMYGEAVTISSVAYAAAITYNLGNGLLGEGLLNSGNGYTTNVQIVLPNDFDNTQNVTFKLKYEQEGTSAGDVVLGVAVKGLSNGDIITSPTFTTQEKTKTLTSTYKEVFTQTFSLSSSSLSAGDAVQIVFYRNVNTTSDTYAGHIYLMSAEMVAQV